MIVSPDAPTALVASVLITTKDRRDELRTAIQSVKAQTAPVELVVVDDGSTDDTSEMVAAEFPNARLLRNERPLGIIAARNRAAAQVSTDILFTLDDDAVFSSPEIVDHVVGLFDEPRVGAVAIPLINFIDGRVVSQRTYEGSKDGFSCVFVYSGGANAKRVGLFRRLGGYGGIGRQGEETDFCLRLLESGHVVRAATCAPVHHFPSPHNRSVAEVQRSAARNAIGFAWRYVPLRHLPLHWAGQILNQTRVGWRQGVVPAAIRGLATGFADVGFRRVERRPVSMNTYRLYRRLVGGEMPFDELQPWLPSTSDAPRTNRAQGSRRLRDEQRA